ncbi:MAG: PAS domain S-box protein [Anaerolineae bacterium]|nr:PAS domain S-box protein [Anaerolineae bacterium]
MKHPTLGGRTPTDSGLPEAIERSSQPSAAGRVGGGAVRANAALMRLLGYEPGEISGDRLAEALTPGEYRDAEARAMAAFISAGQPQCYRKEVTRRDGSRVRVEVLLHALRDEAGVDGYCATYLELEAHREAIFASITDGLVVADLEGNILEMNPAALRLHGFGSVDEARKHLSRYVDQFDLFYADGRPMPLEEWPLSRAIRGETFPRCKVLLKDRVTGREKAYSYAGTHVRDSAGVPYLAILTIRDISDRMQAEREIESLARFPRENPQPVLRVGSDGTILYANPASRPILSAWGRAQGEVLPEEWREQLSASLGSGQNRMLEMHVEGRHFELELVPFTRAGYVNLYGRDVSDRKAIEQARERHFGRLQALVRISRRVLAETTFEGLLHQVTYGACELTGAGVGAAGHGYRDGTFGVGVSSQTGEFTLCSTSNVFCMERGGVYRRLLTEVPSLRLTDQELRSHPDWWGLPEGHPPLRGLLGARTVDASGRPNGVILVSDSLNGEFTEEDEAALSQLAAVASLGLRHIEARAEAEARTRETEAILESIADGVWVYDPEGRIVRMNAAARRLSGYSEVEARQTIAERGPALRLRTSEGRTLTPEALPAARALREETVRSLVMGIEQPDGSTVWVSNSAAPILTADGRLLGAVATSTDITELRRVNDQLEARRTELLALAQDLELEREQLAVTLRSIGDAVVAADPEGFVVLMNAAAERLTGWDEDSLKERTLVELLDRSFSLHYPSGEPLPLQEWPLTDALKGEAFSGLEVELRARDSGTVTVLDCSLQPVRDQEGRLLLTVIAARDITTQKLVEWERRRLEKLKVDFIANTSHELRTPLASVMGYTELLLSGGAGALSPVQQEFLQTVYDSGERLRWLIDDILDVSRMEADKLDLEHARVDLVRLAQGAMERLRPRADQQGVHLDADLPAELPAMLGDPRRLEQVLGNLLSNAIKYTPQGGSVTLSASHEGEWLEVLVRDTGIGIAPEDLPHLFERFHRGRNAINESIGGTGLGLYISKTIVEAHRGRIEVESRPGEGTVVRVLLPVPPKEPVRGA